MRARIVRFLNTIIHPVLRRHERARPVGSKHCFTRCIYDRVAHNLMVVARLFRIIRLFITDG
ncbi:hypothetical protein FCJ60_21470 [Burkholderia metallica]|nr:hypothetical protein [Burkholderia metallica]